jgi:hypothetical protein
MEKILTTPQYLDIENRIINTIGQVNARGFDETEELIDDYSVLIERSEFKNAIITEIYENYFPSKRHEFELQLISEIVDAIINSKLLLFTAGAAASGLIGDVFTNIAKRLLNKIIEGFKGTKKEKQKFETIIKDITKVELYFQKNKRKEINALTNELEIEKERLIPILKLLGYKTYKKNGKKYWEK